MDEHSLRDKTHNCTLSSIVILVSSTYCSSHYMGYSLFNTITGAGYANELLYYGRMNRSMDRRVLTPSFSIASTEGYSSVFSLQDENARGKNNMAQGAHQDDYTFRYLSPDQAVSGRPPDHD